MNKPALSIPRILEDHLLKCPDSMLTMRTIRLAVKAGDLPCIRSGKRILIPMQAFENWMDGEIHKTIPNSGRDE